MELGKVRQVRAQEYAIRFGLGAMVSVFAMVTEAAIGTLEPFLALTLALLGWSAAAGDLYLMLCWLRPGDCDRNQD